MGTNNRQKKISEIDWEKGDVARIKPNWEDEGKDMLVLGPAVFQHQWWVPVSDPYKEDPTFHKEAGLERTYKREDTP